MAEWFGSFEGFAANHPEVGKAAGEIAYLPDDFKCAAQVSASHILVWTGQEPVIAIARKGTNMDDPSRPVADYHGNNPDQPALDAAFWDRPDADVEKDGPGLVEIWAVKNAMLRDGYALKYPAPPESRDHWKVVYPGSG